MEQKGTLLKLAQINNNNLLLKYFLRDSHMKCIYPLYYWGFEVLIFVQNGCLLVMHIL